MAAILTMVCLFGGPTDPQPIGADEVRVMAVRDTTESLAETPVGHGGNPWVVLIPVAAFAVMAVAVVLVL